MVKGKVKLSLCLTNYALCNEDLLGGGGFTDHDTSSTWVVSFTIGSLYLRKMSHRYPLDRRVDGPRNLLDNVERTKSYDFRDSSSDSSAVHPVPIHYTDCATLHLPPCLQTYIHEYISNGCFCVQHGCILCEGYVPEDLAYFKTNFETHTWFLKTSCN
jgi:hypothetical protein